MTILLFIVYFFFGRILPWSMPVTLALYMGQSSLLPKTLTVMILIGILEDITFVRPLGVTSLVLVTLTTAVWLFETQYRSQFLWGWFVFGLGGEAVLGFFEGRVFSWQSMVSQLIILFLVRWISKRLKEPEGIYVGQ